MIEIHLFEDGSLALVRLSGTVDCGELVEALRNFDLAAKRLGRRALSTDDEVAFSALVCMRCRYRDPDLDLRAIATASRVTPEYVCRRFRRATGSSPMNWLKALRATYALRLIIDTYLSIKAIAFECGFGSTASLDRQFRRQFSARPLDFRKAATRRRLA